MYFLELLQRQWTLVNSSLVKRKSLITGTHLKFPVLFTLYIVGVDKSNPLLTRTLTM